MSKLFVLKGVRSRNTKGVEQKFDQLTLCNISSVLMFNGVTRFRKIPLAISGFVVPQSLRRDTESESLIEAFRRGDEEAFKKVYKRFSKPILDLAFQKLRDKEAARDVAQEVFLKVYKARESYQPRFALSTWIWSIANNSITDHLRRLRPREASRDDDGESRRKPLEELIPTQDPGAEMLVERRLRRRLLKNFAKALTRPQRRVIWLRVVHQLTYPEIARKLGVSLSSVKCLAYRSRLTLAQLGCTVALL